MHMLRIVSKVMIQHIPRDMAKGLPPLEWIQQLARAGIWVLLDVMRVLARGLGQGWTNSAKFGGPPRQLDVPRQ